MKNTLPTLKQARQYFKIGEALKKQSKYLESIANFEKAKNIFEAHQEWIPFLSCSYYIGKSHIESSAPQKALEGLLRATYLGKQKGLQKTEVMAELYLEVSSANIALGNLDEVEHYQLEAESIYKSLPNVGKDKFARCYMYMGVFYVIRRDVEKGLQYFQNSVNIFEKIDEKGEHKSSIGTCYLYMGDCFAAKKQLEEARTYYQKNLEINLSIYSEKSYQVNSSYIRLGAVYQKKNELDKSLDYLQRALTIGEELFGTYHAKNAIVHYEIGLSHHKRGVDAFDKARYHFEAAIQIGQKVFGAYHPRIAVAYYHTADTFLIEEKYSTALSFNQKAFATLNKDFHLGEGSFRTKILAHAKSTNNQGIVFMVLNQKAGILYGLHQQKKEVETLQKSFETYCLIVDAAAVFYRSTTSEGTILRIRADTKTLSEKIIELGILLQSFLPNHTDVSFKIFNAFEKSRANLLFINLQATTAGLISQIPKELLQKEQELYREWKTWEKKMKIGEENELTSNREEKEMVSHQLFESQRVYEQFTQELEHQFPQYHRLKQQLPIVSLVDLQLILSEYPYTTLISYFVGESTIYLLVLDAKHFEIVQVPKPKDLTEQVLDFVAAINHSFREEYIELGSALYRLLIAPIAHLLVKPISSENPTSVTPSLLIFPDDVLAQLPFEALLTHPTNNSQPYTNLPYLLLDYSIQYHYSASLWKHGLQQSTQKRLKEDSFIGFAPVYSNQFLKKTLTKEAEFETAYHEHNTRSVHIGGEEFQELLYSEKEIIEICQLFENKGFNAQAFLHEKASLQEFHQAIGEHKYVHISAHNIPNSEDANLSGIVFSPSGKQKRTNEIETVFYLQDAYLLELKADLVVLSCCETGIGKLAKGEGMIAMNRGFLAAGANNVIFTLFKVYDEASCRLTQKLFQHILEGKSYAIALRLAKLEMLQDSTTMPKFWAGYVMIGV